METITLFQEYRLIERSESEVNGAWKGAHLLLFFLAFVFGSFCTFCFHMLMYLFDEKCVLFPKLLSLTSLRQNIIYEFIPEDKEIADMLPVDFLSTQWIDKSACYLPTYVPLVSGIFGLVWTTMFLMCSTGSRTLTGLQRPWRVLLPVFVFSLAMGGLCLYATIVTHNGLQELCVKLGEITGSSTCTYTVNVATLAYERRIRGVYQATRITILSAWLHTACWLLSALLTSVRVLLVVDFQLVKVSAQLKGNIEKMLEHHERQIRTVSPNEWLNNELSLRSQLTTRSQNSVKVHFQKKEKVSRLVDTSSLDTAYVPTADDNEGQFIFTSKIPTNRSSPSLVTTERNKLTRIHTYNSVPKDEQFIVKMIYDLIDSLDLHEPSTISYLSPSAERAMSESKPLLRQYGQQLISAKPVDEQGSESYMDPDKAERLVSEIKRNLEKEMQERFKGSQSGASTSKKALESESIMNITSETRHAIKEMANKQSMENIYLKHELNTTNHQEQIINETKRKKSNLKHKNIQTDDTLKRGPPPKVHISESKTSVFSDIVIESSSEKSPEPKKKETRKKPGNGTKKEKKD